MYAAFLSSILFRRGRGASGTALSDESVDWVRTIATANDEFVAPFLLTAIRQTQAVVPEDVTAYLEMVFAANVARNEAIREQCVEIGRLCEGVGTTACLLKGAAWLFDGSPARADRMMRDIDLLVAPDKIEAIDAALREAGYGPSGVMAEDGHVHSAPLLKRGGVNVELHVELTTRIMMLPAADVLGRATLVAPGLALPAARDRLVHNVLHAQIVNGEYHGGAASLRDSIDVARLLDARDLPWTEIITAARVERYFRQLSGAVHAASLLLRSPLPPAIAEDRGGRWHARRVAWQRKRPVVDRLLRRYGVLRRALAWERDSYALGLGNRRDWRGHLAVNGRRLSRIGAALRRALDAR